MRCYFNLVDGSEVIRDPEGIEVSGPKEARAQALHAISEQRQADPVAARKWSGWTLTVVDSTGRPLFSMPLDDPALSSPIALACIFPGAEPEPLCETIVILQGGSGRPVLLWVSRTGSQSFPLTETAPDETLEAHSKPYPDRT
jgi:hypothetical protein